jgi:tetratricopeptide (TPR) repeat protein
MALFRRRRGTGEDPQAPGGAITVYDVHGRPLHVARDTWRREILPGTLRSAWDDPDRLYDAIVEVALREELYRDVDAASRRLAEIDPNVARGHTVRAIVLQNTGRVGEAQAVLQTALEHERSGVLLTHLARVQAQRGDRRAAQATLEEAISLDPDQDDGLRWWAARIRGAHGDEAMRAALREVARRPGTSRAQLLLGRDALAAGDHQAARRWFEQALDGARDDESVLLEVSGQLGEAGRVEDLFALIAPRYTLARHGPIVGLNLLRAYAAVGNHVGGRELLHELMALQRPDLRERLLEFEGVFDDQRDAEATHELPVVPEVAVLVLDRPPWAVGLHDASWLLPRGPRRGASIAVVPFAVRNAGGGDSARVERATVDGRLARGAALALAEALHFCTDADVRLLLPEVTGQGALVTGTPWTASDLEALAEDEQPDVFVTGVVEAGGLGVVTWRPDDERPLHELRRAGRDGATLLALQDELVDALQEAGAVVARPPAAPYVRPPRALASAYLEALEQSRAMTVAAQGVVSRERIFGERAMLQTPLELALAWPEVEIPALVFLGNLVKSRPEVAAEFAASAIALIDGARTDSAVARLAPLILDVLGERAQARARAAALAPGEPPAYVEWLARLP